MRFVQFCTDVVGVQLTPAQRVLCLVAFDRVEPGQLTGDERELARLLFGNVDTIPAIARDVLAALCGGRSGKTYILAALYLLWRALVADLSRLAPGESGHALAIGPDQRLGRLIVKYALGAANASPHIAPLVGSETVDGFTIHRPDGHTVVIECLPATRGGSALRGRSLVAAVLDECSFFRDESFVVNDAELFRAVAPRVLPSGMVVLCSTAWGGMGLLAEEIERNFGHPVNAIACIAPTVLMRPEMATLVERERRRDPENASREFDCITLADANAAWAVGDVTAAFGPVPGVFRWGTPFCVGDPGESLDSYNLFVCAWGEPDTTPRYRKLKPPEGSGLSHDVFIGWELDAKGQRIPEPQSDRRVLRVFDLLSFKGPEVKQLGMEKVVERIARFMKSHGAKTMISDQRGAPYLAALSARYGVRFRSVPITAQNKPESVHLIRSLFRDGQISAVANHPHSVECKKQWLGYRRITKSGGGFSYSGGSRAAVDDWAACLVTLGASMLLEENAPAADQTRLVLEGSPVNKSPGRRHQVDVNYLRY
jgi:hypothetical protein